MIYRITWMFCQLLFRVLVPRRVTGRKHVPATGGMLLASNHLSLLDPPVVGTGFWRPCAYMAKEELFKNRLFGWFITRLHAFPVRRGGGDRAALKRTLDLVEQGWAVVIFPEGTRSDTGELQEPEMGVGMIAYRSGAPVVPAYIRGTDRVLPKGGGFRPARISVRYGQPLTFAAPAGTRPGREEYESAARAIMAAIAELRDQDAADRS